MQILCNGNCQSALSASRLDPEPDPEASSPGPSPGHSLNHTEVIWNWQRPRANLLNLVETLLTNVFGIVLMLEHYFESWQAMNLFHWNIGLGSGVFFRH